MQPVVPDVEVNTFNPCAICLHCLCLSRPRAGNVSGLGAFTSYGAQQILFTEHRISQLVLESRSLPCSGPRHQFPGRNPASSHATPVPVPVFCFFRRINTHVSRRISDPFISEDKQTHADRLICFYTTASVFPMRRV